MSKLGQGSGHDRDSGTPRGTLATARETPPRNETAALTPVERHKRAPPRGNAGTLVLGAARIEAEAADDWRKETLADEYRARALAPLSADLIAHGVGGELVPTDSGLGAAECRLLDTVQNPTYITADASRDRLDLAQQAGALETALDAATTIDAANSLEKMLAHQLATAHRSAMKLSGEVNRRVDYLANVRGEEQERANI
jgi:hypothetical protein